MGTTSSSRTCSTTCVGFRVLLIFLCIYFLFGDPSAIAATEQAPPFSLTAAQYEDQVNVIFEGYNELPNYVSFLVNKKRINKNTCLWVTGGGWRVGGKRRTSFYPVLKVL